VGKEIALDHLTKDPNYYDDEINKSIPAAPKAKHFVMHYPLNFVIPPGSGKRNSGVMKTIGADGRIKWISARSGLVMDQSDGSPKSARAPGKV
jgi:hypothetical protein